MPARANILSPTLAARVTWSKGKPLRLRAFPLGCFVRCQISSRFAAPASRILCIHFMLSAFHPVVRASLFAHLVSSDNGPAIRPFKIHYMFGKHQVLQLVFTYQLFLTACKHHRNKHNLNPFMHRGDSMVVSISLEAEATSENLPTPAIVVLFKQKITKDQEVTQKSHTNK